MHPHAVNPRAYRHDPHNNLHSAQCYEDRIFDQRRATLVATKAREDTYIALPTIRNAPDGEFCTVREPLVGLRKKWISRFAAGRIMDGAATRASSAHWRQ
jgi:hypothetical protein